MRDTLQFLDVGQGSAARTIAVRVTSGEGTPVVWLGGFKSDMMSTKAMALDAWCAARNSPMVRMDYSGHGESSGAFTDGTISRWVEDAVAVLTSVVETPPIIVGSSMGGWIAVLIAKRLMEQGKTEIMDKGVWNLPSEYSDEPTPITRGFIEDGRNNLVFGKTFQVGCPVHILQGMKDPDVPFAQALKLVEHLPLDTVVTTMISDGDHRLSRGEDIQRLLAAVGGIGVRLTTERSR
jgi:pimeloyl-ACP methyl ester carboxylesterase